ncbi:DNA repair protein RecN [Chloracidobacterium validum]|uniref:DNA repair protein RecN n=1 Tax=Chloracidobacterium validum TaxID=2821543 RepID=A0ABX8BAA0_9BACT|nr:DNA repair protein RecN [Chloracidobacterium validum]QUW03864.1 DNA repair protein RecN [Chloracidobacterium validum]
MLRLLNIENIAVVHRQRVAFDAGLTIVTGETGAGKSLVVDALALAVGGRATADIIRAGESRAVVEALFDCPAHPAVARILSEADIEAGDELLIRREVAASGKGRLFINDQLCSVATVRALRPYLVDIHGQGDQQTLMFPSAHAGVLDAFGQHVALSDATATAFSAWQTARRDLDQLKRDEASRLQRLDMLNFQRADIERVAPQAGEDEDLRRERMRLSNAERLLALAAGSYDLLYEREASALDLVAQALRRVEDLAADDPALADTVATLEAARYGIEEAAFALRDYADALVVSPERLREVEARLDALDQLKRKYGGTLAQVLATFDQIQHELANIENYDADVRRLTAAVEAAAQAYQRSALALRSARQAAARRFEAALEQELHALALPQARLVVAFDERHVDAPETWEASGLEAVEFLFTSNPGEPPRPLSKVASGGELARMMLGVKSILAPTDIPRTMVFDEVDVGISGRVAEAVGVRLRRLAERQQVLCITHQAQVARFATTHLRVEKSIVDGRTRAEITLLDARERVEELARIIGGAVVTDSARRAARDLLASEGAVGAPTT